MDGRIGVKVCDTLWGRQMLCGLQLFFCVPLISKIRRYSVHVSFDLLHICLQRADIFFNLSHVGPKVAYALLQRIHLVINLLELVPH